MPPTEVPQQEEQEASQLYSRTHCMDHLCSSLFSQVSSIWQTCFWMHTLAILWKVQVFPRQIEILQTCSSIFSNRGLWTSCLYSSIFCCSYDQCHHQHQNCTKTYKTTSRWKWKSTKINKSNVESHGCCWLTLLSFFCVCVSGTL